jgi:hypothetical protein
MEMMTTFLELQGNFPTEDFLLITYENLTDFWDSEGGYLLWFTWERVGLLGS